MNVSLTPKLEGFVKAKVKTGDYNNASEVVREALRLLQQEDEELHQRKIARLRKAIQSGLEAPDADGYDIKKVVTRLKKRRGAKVLDAPQAAHCRDGGTRHRSNSDLLEATVGCWCRGAIRVGPMARYRSHLSTSVDRLGLR